MKDFKIQNSGETKHIHVYVRENHQDKGQGCQSNQDLYSVIFMYKILLVFYNLETILRLFSSLMETNFFRRKAIFAIKRHQD
jgi:hypothetical protein